MQEAEADRHEQEREQEQDKHAQDKHEQELSPSGRQWRPSSSALSQSSPTPNCWGRWSEGPGGEKHTDVAQPPGISRVGRWEAGTSGRAAARRAASRAAKLQPPGISRVKETDVNSTYGAWWMSLRTIVREVGAEAVEEKLEEFDEEVDRLRAQAIKEALEDSSEDEEEDR